MTNRFIGCCVLFFLITGCVPFSRPITTVQLEQKGCKDSCAQRLKDCGQRCDKDYGHCAANNKRRAAIYYNRYRCQQRQTGQMIALDTLSYQDPLGCSKPACDCYDDYQVCKQNCSGRIYKLKQVVPACN